MSYSPTCTDRRVRLQNKALLYGLLLKAQTLSRIAADPKHLGAWIGLTSVLHTWGSALTHHPHGRYQTPTSPPSHTLGFVPLRISNNLNHQQTVAVLAVTRKENPPRRFSDVGLQKAVTLLCALENPILQALTQRAEGRGVTGRDYRAKPLR